MMSLNDDAEFFDALPEDDEQAFLMYCRKVKAEVIRLDADGDPSTDSVRLFKDRLEQAVELFDLPPRMRSVIVHSPEIKDYSAAKAFVAAVDGLYDFKMLMESRKKFSENFDTVEIREDYKQQIRVLVNKVKDRVDTANLEVQKRESLMSKLNLFLRELDNERTRLTALTAAFVQVSSAVGESAEKLEPAVALFERIMKAIGLGSKERPGLPKSEEDLKRLPAPEKIDE